MPGWMPLGFLFMYVLSEGVLQEFPGPCWFPVSCPSRLKKGGVSSALSSSTVWHFWISGHLRLPITCRPLDNWGYLGLRDGRMPMAFLDPTSVLSWSIATFFSSGIVGVFPPCGSFAYHRHQTLHECGSLDMALSLSYGTPSTSAFFSSPSPPQSSALLCLRTPLRIYRIHRLPLFVTSASVPQD